MTFKPYILISVLCSVLTLNACGKSDSPPDTVEIPTAEAAEETGVNVAFDYRYSALLTKKIDNSLFDDFVANIISGTMEIENLDTSSIETVPWSVNLDKNDLNNIQSLKSLQLTPANYNFTLVLGQNDQQYVGSVVHTIEDGVESIIAMTIRPVIGEGQINTSVVSELIDFRFNYTAADIANAGLADPSIGITIDNGVEQIFRLDPAIGLSDFMSLNLIPGNYDFNLRLFDGGIQVGKSVETQGSSVSVSAGFDVSLDIVPLSGEFSMSLTVDGGDADINITVPSDVVEEAGDLSNLETILSVVGPENALQETFLTFTQDGSAYSATTTLTDIFFGDVNFELEFNDLANGTTIGGCVDGVTISNAPVAVECQLALRRTSLASGSILSSVGVNVFDLSGQPVSGAIVSVDGQDVGITNSAAFSAPGYTKLLLAPGRHQVAARLGNSTGDLTYNATALSVDNFDLVIDQTLLLQDPFDSTQTGTAAPSGYSFGCLSAGGAEGGIASGVMSLGSRYNDPQSDWCPATTAVTEHSFIDSEIISSRGFFVSADIANATSPNSSASFAFGAETPFNSNDYDVTLAADAIVSFSDNNMNIDFYAGGEIIESHTSTIPYLMTDISNIRIEILMTGDFANGSLAAVNEVFINNTPLGIPIRTFTWDGGNNHIALTGAAGNPVSGDGASAVDFDNLQVVPR